MAIEDSIVVMYMASFLTIDPKPAPAIVSTGTSIFFEPEKASENTMREILDELRLIREILEHPPKSLTEKRMRQMVRGVLKKGKGNKS